MNSMYSKSPDKRIWNYKETGIRQNLAVLHTTSPKRQRRGNTPSLTVGACNLRVCNCVVSLGVPFFVVDPKRLFGLFIIA